jgi:glycine/serine hydroxymethyltransferase
MKEPEMDAIAEFMDRVLNNRTDAKLLQNISEEVKTFCERFPLYPELA